MTAAALILVAPFVILLVAGVAIVWTTVVRIRRDTLGRVVGAIRLVAGAGTAGFGVLALSPLWSDLQYGVVILPVTALIAAALWNAVLLGAAALVQYAQRRRTRGAKP
ncbi:hypothetical protein ACFJGV_09895 [Cnuibacter sp. UC19_7]|uniref:hypothetical protein n=1 Tax=Cnuibacter sp. UC19_7 TaxID=3350166 RepID=UPI003671C2AA